MTNLRAVAITMMAAALCGLPLTLLASVSGPVPARTGGFGEMTCHQCHWDNPLNDPAGQLSLDGLPSSYTPGERYTITLRLGHPELVRAGFQLSARLEDGANAGTLVPTDGRTTTIADDGGRVRYLQHTPAGTEAEGPTLARWTFAWVAPASNGPVRFHAAANASNGDASPLGDFVLTATATVQP